MRRRVSGVAEGATRPARSAGDRRTTGASAITPQLGEGPATESVRPGSNSCGAQEQPRDANGRSWPSIVGVGPPALRAFAATSDLRSKHFDLLHGAPFR